MPSALAIPPHEIFNWAKGMMRRAYGKDTFGKTLLQNGFSALVSDLYKFHDEDEHKTQAMVGEMMDDDETVALYKTKQELKSEVKRFTQIVYGAKGNPRWLEKPRRRLQMKKKGAGYRPRVRELGGKRGRAPRHSSTRRPVSAPVATIVAACKSMHCRRTAQHWRCGTLLLVLGTDL